MKFHFPNKTALSFILLCLFLLCGGCQSKLDAPTDDGKLSVVATIFPQYDFARAISGGSANIALLVPPGGDTHAFEPSPSDIARIAQADLFLYTGDVMEPWVSKLLKGIDAPNLRVVDLSSGIQLHENGEDDGHDHGPLDPHIWTSPVIAAQMLQTACQAFSEVDPANSTMYQNNYQAYAEALAAVDKRFRDITSQSVRNDFIFGSRFACSYFAEEYGLHPDSPYASCAGEAEPGVQDMTRIIDYVKANQIPVIFHQELTDDKVARAVAEAAGTKLLLFHSCHNVSKDEFEQGVTYVSLMNQNADHLKEGLQ